jgi:NADH-quinone oxidoreductase subunit A
MRAQLELFSIALVCVLGAFFIWFNMLVGRLVRPRVPHPEKEEVYECGEPAIGGAWAQFDLRFYVLALVFVIFDVELALLFPWAVVYGLPGAAGPALVDLAIFAGVLLVGFAYLWRAGYLDWVWSMPQTRAEPPRGAGEAARMRLGELPPEVVPPEPGAEAEPAASAAPTGRTEEPAAAGSH